MRPKKLKSKLFLDGGDPEETKAILEKMGFLDGQTTNPSLVAKNPAVKKRLEEGNFFSEEELLSEYKKIVKTLSDLIPKGSVSIEVYSDNDTKSEEMFEQGKKMFGWIPNAHIKFPTNYEGIKAAEKAVKEDIKINMTLCFTQGQGAAVYAATKGAKKGDVFLSPFVGRLDDRGEDGMQFIANTIKMYEPGDGHVELLTASVRTMDHFKYALQLESPIITVPYKVLVDWVDEGMPIPDDKYKYDPKELKEIPYEEITLDKEWTEYKYKDELIENGITKFAADWNKLLGK